MSERIRCERCEGHGVVDGGYHNPCECPDCGGSGQVTRYEGGALAQYPGGPFLGHDQPKRCPVCGRWDCTIHGGRQ